MQKQGFFNNKRARFNSPKREVVEDLLVDDDYENGVDDDIDDNITKSKDEIDNNFSVIKHF